MSHFDLAFVFSPYLFEVSGRLHLADRLHEGITNEDADICTRVALWLMPESGKVCLTQVIGSGA